VRKFSNFLRFLEKIATETDIIIPKRFIDTVNYSIKRDGIALARIPENYDLAVLRYGGSSPMEMLKFRARTMPDLTSWKLFECLVVAVFVRLYYLTRRADSSNPINIIQAQGTRMNTRFNIFSDLLCCLIKQLEQSFGELNVYIWITYLIEQ
jgi:hypothetical protein